MSTRPAPRPRPRPRPRAPTAEPPAPSLNPPSATSPAPTPLEPVSINVAEDEDAMFFKNRNRTAQTWKKLHRLADESEVKKPKPVSDEGSDVEVAETTPRRKQKRTENSDSLPAWTKSTDAIELSSSDDDDDDEILLQIHKNSTTPRGKRSHREEAQRRITKRARSRSRSVTPPPELASATVQHARDTVRRMLGSIPRAPSPTADADDSVDGIELDPELAMIARSAKIEAQRQMSTPAIDSRSSSPVRVGGPENVTIKVRWKSHPLDPSPRNVVYEYLMRRHDSFRELFEETADSAGVLVDHLIISYEGNRVFPSASPHGIGVWDEAVLEGCDKITHEYLLAHPNTSPEPSADHPPHSRGASPTQSDAHTDAGSGSEDGEDDDKMKLIFRSAVSKDVTLTVRPTTKCSVILKAFLKRVGMADKYPASPVKKGRKPKTALGAGPALMVDGDRLNPNAAISSADLEDGDLVEVVGL